MEIYVCFFKQEITELRQGSWKHIHKKVKQEVKKKT
jgi:hypothetical protein